MRIVTKGNRNVALRVGCVSGCTIFIGGTAIGFGITGIGLQAFKNRIIPGGKAGGFFADDNGTGPRSCFDGEAR